MERISTSCRCVIDIIGTDPLSLGKLEWGISSALASSVILDVLRR